jgi:glucose/arabinose dehydrogenase
MAIATSPERSRGRKKTSPTSTTTSSTTTTVVESTPRLVTDFGFPGCVYAAGPNGAVLMAQNANPAVTDPCGTDHTRPEALLGLHVSANGLAFGPNDSFWNGDLFIAEYGNNPGSSFGGHKVVRVPIDADGRAGAPVDVVVGVAPLDLAFGPPGTGLYVADFVTGLITLLRAPA